MSALASDVLFLRPSDAHYKDYLPAANLRTRLSPRLRAVCKTEHAVSVMVDWVRSNSLSFAVRCGGHSYEGFSQSTDVVIDLRGLASITVDKSAGVVTVGSGAALFPSAKLIGLFSAATHLDCRLLPKCSLSRCLKVTARACCSMLRI